MSELLSRDPIIKLRNMGKVFRAKTAQEWCEANHYEINESISRGLKYGCYSVYMERLKTSYLTFVNISLSKLD